MTRQWGWCRDRLAVPPIARQRDGRAAARAYVLSIPASVAV
jgi:hypothetical protein